MALMMSNVIDIDGKIILAACPFFKENPICVNSCALFVPEEVEIEGEVFADYRTGRCGMTAAHSQLMHALPKEEEIKIRKQERYE